MKTALYLLSFFACLLAACFVSLPASAQLCPGGGVNFSSAVSFDPNWIYGCNTGTSCNGGVNFSNLAACQPTTALDACAPAPSCGNITQNGSNIWFKFYPLGPTATISCFQNTSLVIGIQVFSGGPACGTLTEVGCALAGGPSSGVQLHLSGLVAGQLYYFRIFGSSNPVSQRTGLYCFCGTTGLSNVILPVAMSGFHGAIVGDAVRLDWTAAHREDYLYFDVQRSSDGNSFASIGRVDGSEPTGATAAYSYLDQPGSTDTSYYRLKGYTDEEHYTYSAIIAVRQPAKEGFRFFFDAESRNLQITVPQSTKMAILTTSGSIVKTVILLPGRNSISTANLAAGIYFVHDISSNTTRRFIVLNR